MPDFIIVGNDGTEHHFPDGMEPQRAIQVVKNSELAKANKKPLSEPTDYWGGVRKGANDYLDEVGRSALEGAAHPQTAGDFLGLLLPSALGMSGGSSVLRGMKAASESEPVGNKVVRGAVKATRSATGAMGKAADAIPASSVYAPAKLPLKAVQKAGEVLPTEAKMLGVEQYKPNVSGVPDNGVDWGEMQGPEHPPVQLESAQDLLMRDATGGAETPSQPDHVPYGGVEVPYKAKRPRMGKEVDNPFGKDSTTSDTRMDELLGKLGGTEGVTVTPESAKLKLSAPELADSLRRYYGSRDGGRMLFPNDPAGGAEALKRMAPGPSRIPLTAQDRINNVQQPQSLEDALRDIILKRSNP